MKAPMEWANKDYGPSILLFSSRASLHFANLPNPGARNMARCTWYHADLSRVDPIHFIIDLIVQSVIWSLFFHFLYNKRVCTEVKMIFRLLSGEILSPKRKGGGLLATVWASLKESITEKVCFNLYFICMCTQFEKWNCPLWEHEHLINDNRVVIRILQLIRWMDDSKGTHPAIRFCEAIPVKGFARAVMTGMPNRSRLHVRKSFYISCLE